MDNSENFDTIFFEAEGHKRGVFLDADICVKCDEDWPCPTVRKCFWMVVPKEETKI